MEDNYHEERAWLDRIQSDDESALDLIFEKYYTHLYQIANQVLSDSGMARDMVQEVFFRFWQNRTTISIKTSLKGYLQRSIINQCISFKRGQGKVSFSENSPAFPDNSADIQEILEATGLENLIRAAIDQLPDQCALIFRLSRFEEMSYQEIALHLGISPKTVENQIGKALKSLRHTLKPFLSFVIVANLVSRFF